MAKTSENFGAIHILVNNAATFIFGHIKGANKGSGTKTDKLITNEEWIEILKTNIIGYSKCIEHCVPYMQKNKIPEL